MPAAYVSINSTVSDPGWTTITYSTPGVESLSVAGWTWQWTASPDNIPGGNGPSGAGSDDIDWALPGSLSKGARRTSAGWGGGFFGGLDPSKQYIVVATGSWPGTGRTLDFRVNGGSVQTVPTDDGAGNANTTEGAIFNPVSPNASGEIALEFQTGSSSSGDGYFTCFGIVSIEGASFTLFSTDIYPNSSVSGTGTNYGGMPSVLTMFDGSGNAFSSSGVSFPDLSFTGSASSFSFDTTTPSKPAEGESAAWIKYGAITINIPDPGE